MISRFILFSAISIPLLAAASPQRILHLPMAPTGDGQLSELISGQKIDIFGRHAPESVAGASGEAWRLDGYSSFAQGDIPSTTPAGAVSFSLWVAPETYPVVKFDTPTDEKIRMAGTLDDETRQGWSFSLGYSGKYAFECYSGGWKVNVEASDLLPCNEWSRLVAVADPSSRTVTLFRNGVEVGKGKCMNSIDLNSSLLTVGKSPAGDISGPFLINTFNGIIDELEIFDGALSSAEFTTPPENAPVMSVSASRFSGNKLRPLFHGMPSANWTNESHGMVYADGRYHLFFQKNANGPFMTRLHWGHISSENLYDWREEPIALAPGEPFDIKGCWSGCVFSDDIITDGQPNIIYTAVDYGKATIALASPCDNDLLKWDKQGVIINGRPSGLSDDFRDPYFFRQGDKAYIIVGSSKDGIGTTTLHEYLPATGTWSNDGRSFFSGTDASLHGTFWEMPNVTQMENGKWLFTVTPLNTSSGVHTLYWVGDISADGTFIPDAGNIWPKDVESISKDGYGLLSPTVFRHGDKTLAIGIVPDKVSTESNCNWGWAHNYSLPREWSLDPNGELCQRPFPGLTQLRSASRKYSLSGVTLDDVLPLSPVEGRQIEILGKFVVGSASFGFNFLKNDSGLASITYTPASGELTVDFTGLRRLPNDNGTFDGIYSCQLPQRPAAGEILSLNLFLDGSILDIFVNDRWATSIRVFPTEDDADGVEAFSFGGSTMVSSLDAWVLENTSSNIPSPCGSPSASLQNVYTISGQLIRENVNSEDILTGLPAGLYMVGDRKILVK